MVFSSLLFTFFFLPLIVGIYYLAKENYRNYILLVASLLFYAYGEPRFVLIMLASIVINYVVALGVNSAKQNGHIFIRRLLLFVCICANVLTLFIYKYLDFSITVVNKIFRTDFDVVGIVLPIGISFFTFQAMSYVIDVYKGTVEVQKNPFYVALYISFFPQLIAGPIVRYSTIEDQIVNRTCSLDKFAEGVRRFLLGFCKKVILANNLSVVATEVFKMNPVETNGVILWIGSICYSLQIFFDFSGYSDMAIGLGKMFGFEFNENFNYPYISKSITEFWRRWHISLSSWFRDYVYIPLGGSRVSFGRHIFNMFVVWMLTGIWHGANYTFIVWGLMYFLLLVIEKYIIKPEKRNDIVFKCVWGVTTLACVNFGWVLFNSTSLHFGLEYCLGMIGMCGNYFSIDSLVVRYLREYGFFIVIGALFSTPIMKSVEVKIKDQKNGICYNIIVPLIYGIVFLWAISFLILGAHNPFIYFNF